MACPEWIEQAGEALGALSCPFYRGVGSCQSGCYDAPACQVDEPEEGWLAQLANAVREGEEVTSHGTA